MIVTNPTRAVPWNAAFGRAELARRYLADFILSTYPSYKMGWFSREVCKAIDWFLAEVQVKRSPRLILEAPPRHGKTEIVSRRLPAFAFGRNPDLEIIATSHTADLAGQLNRDVQRIIDSPEYSLLFPDTNLFGKNIRTVAYGTWIRNSDQFEIVNRKGTYRSAGIGGSITGRGADIFIIDDPVKDAEQAFSETYRETAWQWFTSVARPRVSAGGGVLVIMTRWHEDDLAGRLETRAKNGEGEQYRVLRFPAVAEENEPHRKIGEALHPERWSLADLEGIFKAVGERVKAALYQQRPAAAEGQIYKRAWWRHYMPVSDDPKRIKELLDIYFTVTFWDTAFKEKRENDYTAGVTIGLSRLKYYVLHVYRKKVEFPQLKQEVAEHYAKWLPDSVLVEDKASGQSLIQELQRETAMPILAVKVDRDKIARANAVTPLVQAGAVLLPEYSREFPDYAPWLADFMDEISSFPAAPHDDMVDAFNGALAELKKGGEYHATTIEHGPRPGSYDRYNRTVIG